MALVWFPALAPRSATGSPLSVTRTLMSAEAETLAPEPPAVALPRLICICTSNSRCGARYVFRLLWIGHGSPPHVGPRAARS